MRAKRLYPALFVTAFFGTIFGLGVGLGLQIYWFITAVTNVYLGDWSLPPG